MEKEMEQENYKKKYAVIPANIRYDEDLTPNAKLLYGEITALCNERGYCWATNEYFSKLYKKDPRTIRRWLEQLAQKKYIYISFIYKEDTHALKKRIIKLNECEIQTLKGEDKNVRRYGQKCPKGEDKNVLYNNTIYNNTINNKEKNIYKKRKINFKNREYETLENLYDNFEGGE